MENLACQAIFFAKLRNKRILEVKFRPMSLSDKIYRLLETYIRHLPIEEKIAYLTRFGDKAEIEEITGPNAELSHVFGRELKRMTVNLDFETARRVAEKIKSDLLDQEEPEPVDLLELQMRDELNPLTADNPSAFLKRFSKLYPPS